jgi:hypothetical protein
MNIRLLVICSALAATGCADLSMGRRHPEQVVAADANTITLRWNSWELSEQAVRAGAVLYCDGRLVEEASEVTREDRLGMTRSRTWRCVGLG